MEYFLVAYKINKNESMEFDKNLCVVIFSNNIESEGFQYLLRYLNHKHISSSLERNMLEIKRYDKEKER